jgi:hypothetical protein
MWWCKRNDVKWKFARQVRLTVNLGDGCECEAAENDQRAQTKIGRFNELRVSQWADIRDS